MALKRAAGAAGLLYARPRSLRENERPRIWGVYARRGMACKMSSDPSHGYLPIENLEVPVKYLYFVYSAAGYDYSI